MTPARIDELIASLRSQQDVTRHGRIGVVLTHADGEDTIAALERLQITEAHIDQAIRFLEERQAANALFALKGVKP